METFLDGGLFEVLIAFFLMASLNYIFSRRFLLIFLSVVILVSPVLLFILKKSEIYNWLIVLSILNSILLVCLLWKTKKDHPIDPLFRLEPLKSRWIRIREKWGMFFLNRKSDNCRITSSSARSIDDKR